MVMNVQDRDTFLFFGRIFGTTPASGSPWP
jgi:hypothetical protein